MPQAQAGTATVDLSPREKVKAKERGGKSVDKDEAKKLKEPGRPSREKKWAFYNVEARAFGP